MDIRKKSKRQKIKRVTWIPLKHGDDLLNSVSDFCLQNDIQAGFITAIGALQKAKFGYYDQKERKYQENSMEESVEIISCLGNVSIKDGKPFVHLHISVADDKGNVFGGHLNGGCLVFAAECAIFELAGDKLERKPDKLTGLSLWDFS